MLNMSTESDTSSDSECVLRDKLDEFGRPLERPNFQSIGESSVLSRVKDFLPLLKAAGMNLCEPKLVADGNLASGDIQIPRTRLYSDDSSVSSESSSSSYGVEVDVGMGVYDVNGIFDENLAATHGIPVVESNISTFQSNDDSSKSDVSAVPCNLIQEIDGNQ